MKSSLKCNKNWNLLFVNSVEFIKSRHPCNSALKRYFWTDSWLILLLNSTLTPPPVNSSAIYLSKLLSLYVLSTFLTFLASPLTFWVNCWHQIWVLYTFSKLVKGDGERWQWRHHFICICIRLNKGSDELTNNRFSLLLLRRILKFLANLDYQNYLSCRQI